jgi:threonyl-tRNA synthetase
VLPLSEKSDEYAGQVADRLRQAGFRVSADLQSARVQAKIREAQLDLIPYMLVVGPKEAETNSVAVRCRIDGDLGVMSLDAAIAKLSAERDARTIRQIIRNSAAVLAATSGEANEY